MEAHPEPRRSAPDGAPNELLSLAQNFQSASSVGLLALPVKLALQEPPKPAPEKEPELSRKMVPLDGLAVKPARPARSEPFKPVPAPVPARLSSPAVDAPTAFSRAAFGLQAAGPAPAAEISFQAAPGGNRRSRQPAAAPLPLRRQAVAFVRAELPTPEHSGLALADLSQTPAGPSDIRLKPVVPYRNGQPEHAASTPLAYQSSALSVPASHLKLTGESLADLLDAVQASAEEVVRTAVDAIQASFSEQPALGLLSAPAEIVSPPAPPAAQWLRSQKPKFTAIAPELTGRSTVSAGPQAPPLAGPSLPPQLLNLGRQNSKSRGNRRRSSAWPVSLLVATVLILGAGSLYQFVTQGRDTKAASATAPVQVLKAAPPPHVRVAEEHPAARSVEVAGVRIVTGPNKRPQLQYLVINHSSNEITGLNIHVVVRSEEAPGDTPLCSISSPIAALGPNQSKEIRADLDPSLIPSPIPDWHSLRTEVLVARQ
jgi:hypothetical protein